MNHIPPSFLSAVICWRSNWLKWYSGGGGKVAKAAQKHIAKSPICIELIKGQLSQTKMDSSNNFFPPSPLLHSLFHTRCLLSQSCVRVHVGTRHGSTPLSSNWCKWKEWRRLGKGWPCYNRGGSPQLITRSLPRCFKLINSSPNQKVPAVVQPLQWLHYLLKIKALWEQKEG